MTRQRYAQDITFQDPVVRLRGRDAYIANIHLLNMIFGISFEVLSLRTRAPDHIGVRCGSLIVFKPRSCAVQRSCRGTALVVLLSVGGYCSRSEVCTRWCFDCNSHTHA